MSLPSIFLLWPLLGLQILAQLLQTQETCVPKGQFPYYRDCVSFHLLTLAGIQRSSWGGLLSVSHSLWAPEDGGHVCCVSLGVPDPAVSPSGHTRTGRLTMDSKQARAGHHSKERLAGSLHLATHALTEAWPYLHGKALTSLFTDQ